MNSIKALAVLGGDARQIAMAGKLIACGYSVTLWGFGSAVLPTGAQALTDWREAVAVADAVILPLPISTDGVRVHAPLHTGEGCLRISSLLDVIGKKPLLGGRISESVRDMAEARQVPWLDYFESELLQLQNAVPTAEGAIGIAMHELPVTLHGCGAAVIGYGRIGQALSRRLAALGARVTVYARRGEQRALAEICSHRAKELLTVEGKATPVDAFPDTRVIFNTVPGRILTREILSKIPRNCLLVDLASAPGGIDQVAANELGFRSVWGTSLPGKCAPETAGEIIADAVHALIRTL